MGLLFGCFALRTLAAAGDSRCCLPHLLPLCLHLPPFAQLLVEAASPLLTEANAASAAGQLGTATASEQQLALEVRQAAAAARTALAEWRQGDASHTAAHLLPAAQQLAAALLAWWRRPEQQAAAALEAAQAAAARSCAYLRCSNLAAEGGPAAGQQEGSMRCR